MRYLTGIAVVMAVLCSVAPARSQVILGFQGGETFDTWGYTVSGQSGLAMVEATLAPNKTTGARSLVAGGDTGGGNCFGSGSGNGPDVARSFTFMNVDLSTCNQFPVTLTFNWGNRFPACVGTGWDAGEDLIFVPYYNYVAQAPITIQAGNNNAQFSIHDHTFTYTVPPCTPNFHFVVYVTTNRADELLFLDDVRLTVPQFNAPMNPLPPITGPTTICVGYPGPNWYQVPNNPGANYVWSGLPSTAQFTTVQGFGSINVDWGVTPAGTYTVVLNEADVCGNLGPEQEIQVQIVNGSAPPTISGPTSLCNGETGVLTSSQTTDIEWSTGETTASITVTGPGTYTLDYLTDCGVAQTLTYTITASSGLQVTTTVTPVSCLAANSGAIQVNSSSSNLQYSLNGGAFQTSNTFSGLVAGTYTIDVVSAGGCSTQTTAVVPPQPTLIVTASTPGTFCDGETAQLNGSVSMSGTTSYYWTGPNGFVTNDQNPSGMLEPGVYHLDAMVNGCIGEDEVMLEIHESPVVQFSATQVCEGTATEFSSAGSSVNAPDQIISWAWTFGDGQTGNTANPNHTYSSAGIYAATLVVTTQGGCSASLSQDVGVNETPVADFSYSPQGIDVSDPTLEFTNLSSSADSYLWFFDSNGETSTEFSPVYVYPQVEGTYVVNLIAASNNGCVDSIQRTITIGNGMVFYIPNAFTPNGDGINDTFLPVFTSGMDEAEYSCTLFNRWGEIIFETTDIYSGWDGKYENAPVPDGTYIWSITYKNSENAEKQRIDGHVVLLK